MDLRDRSEKQVLSIIEDAAKAKEDADAQKISDLYLSFMDEAKANKLGLSTDPSRTRCEFCGY